MIPSNALLIVRSRYTLFAEPCPGLMASDAAWCASLTNTQDARRTWHCYLIRYRECIGEAEGWEDDCG